MLKPGQLVTLGSNQSPKEMVAGSSWLGFQNGPLEPAPCTALSCGLWWGLVPPCLEWDAPSSKQEDFCGLGALKRQEVESSALGTSPSSCGSRPRGTDSTLCFLLFLKVKLQKEAFIEVSEGKKAYIM